ncbi:MAG: hypothetical protein HY735_17795 [Verrucomicrobia bacterium]|nr:hypothetical protein [Verrucomicrobiota bacterium]
MNEHLDQLLTSVPDAAETISSLKALQEATKGIPFPLIVEPPVFVLAESDQPPTMHTLTQDLVVAWMAHMSFGCRVRMEALERSIFSELANGSFYVPVVLIRSHLEIAGCAAYTNKVLMKFSETQDYASLGREILRTAYSSAVAKHDPTVIKTRVMPGVFAEPRSVMNMIDALQSFFDIAVGSSVYDLRAQYACLCDFAHPAIRGTSSFVTLGGERGGGWERQYSSKESVEPSAIKALLTMLLWSMRCGYSNAAFIHCGRLIGEADGFRYDKPSLQSCKDIWTVFMQCESSEGKAQ